MALRSGKVGWPFRPLDSLAVALLVAHVAVLLSLRTVAWPELTTPAYLQARGLLLYRDVKFQHTPGTMAALALAFWLFGIRAAVVHAFAAAGPVLAHFALLRQTRPYEASVRITTSALLVIGICAFEGNAVWPSVLMTALALPIADRLGKGRSLSAGLLIGCAILLKQPAAFLLLVCAVFVAWRRGVRSAGLLLVAGSLPYAATVLVFGALGAAGDLLRWTILVPLTVRPAGLWYQLPDARSLGMLGLAFVPAGIEAFRERPGVVEPDTWWLLIVAAGFVLVGVPRAGAIQLVAAFPPLALGAARLLQGLQGRARAAAFAFLSVLLGSQAAIVVAGERFDGRLVFWNDEPSMDRLAEVCAKLPPGTPLHSTVWENVLPRCGLLPPGRIYVHPWMTWFHPVDDIGERVRRAAQAPGTAVVSLRVAGSEGTVVGPYDIVRR